SMADQVILLPIYPARELPIEGVDASIILKKITASDKKLLQSRKDLPMEVKSSNFEVLLTVGAGDICLELPEIIKEATNS
ncbi:MAG: UDP-N-acetylmuramate--L-alanine ligase, partial [Paramuribaculum sp.]|nr:UDP-N-acetylmuramate--L-alanine ligase [Paramuribaculum sp.]